MRASKHIRYLQRKDIDADYWDACVSGSPAGLIYAKSWFLDAVSKGRWSALVQGDYEAVMPLVWNRKLGFAYIYMPYGLPMLGLFQPGEANPDAGPFLSAIPRQFRLCEIDLAENNRLEKDPAPYYASERHNYWLPLSANGDQLKKGYKRLARRMLQRAQQQGLQVQRDASVNAVIHAFQQNYGTQMPGIKKEFYKRITDASLEAQKRGLATAYLAQDPQGNTQAFYLIYRDEKFVYSVIGGSTPAGKDNGAFYLLTDAAIQDHCLSGRAFRFEGSDIPGIAFFNSQFGAQPQSYYHLLLNRLPPFLRRLKPTPPLSPGLSSS